MQKSGGFFLFIFTLLFISGCKKEEDFRPAVEAAMATFAASLQSDLPTAATVTERVRVYLNGQPTYFFGSTVTLLDANGKPIDLKKPYWTEPYFDAGGGDIWMQTYSVPIIINNKVVAVATTDLAVDKP